MENADLWPRPNAQDVHMSVTQLVSVINGFDNLALQKHDQCLGMQEMRKSTNDILAGIESPLLDSHRQALKARNQAG